MEISFGIDLSEFKDINLTLPNISPEFIDVIFNEVEDFQIKYDCQLPFALKNEICTSSILESKCLVSGEDVKKVYEIFLGVSEENSNFSPGQTIGILPENCFVNVNYIIEKLQLQNICDQLFCLKIKGNTLKKGAKIPNFIPRNYTIRKTLEKCLDFRSVPKKLFLRALSNYTQDVNEKLLLNILSSKEGSNQYNELFLNKRTNFLDILRSLKTCLPPFNILLEHLPRLMPRPYSIANSPLRYPNKIRIVFSILDQGLTSCMLENLILSKNVVKKIDFYFRQNNQFLLPKELGTSIILIGPGTGISPFLGFLEHRSHLMEKDPKLRSIVWLFTGCRYRTKNYLYESELKSFMNDGCLTKLFESFSRDDNYKFKYVQDQIKENEKEFVELFLEDTTKIYICGESKKMAPDVEATIQQCIQTIKGFTKEEASKYIVKSKKEGKYIEDIWT